MNRDNPENNDKKVPIYESAEGYKEVKELFSALPRDIAFEVILYLMNRSPENKKSIIDTFTSPLIPLLCNGTITFNDFWHDEQQRQQQQQQQQQQQGEPSASSVGTQSQQHLQNQQEDEDDENVSGAGFVKRK